MVKNYKVWISSEEQFVVNKLPLDKNKTFLFFLTDYGVALYVPLSYLFNDLCLYVKLGKLFLVFWLFGLEIYRMLVFSTTDEQSQL